MFLDHYLNYDQHSLPKNWSDALNMMTANLRHEAVLQMQKNDAVGKLQDEQARSESKLSSIEASQDPLVYTAFGVRTLHHMNGKSEAVDEIVEAYKIRLAVTERSAKNPTGLYIAEYSATQIHGEPKTPQFDDGAEQNNDALARRQLPSQAVVQEPKRRRGRAAAKSPGTFSFYDGLGLSRRDHCVHRQAIRLGDRRAESPVPAVAIRT